MAVSALIIDLDGVIRRWEHTPDVERAHGLPEGAIFRAAWSPELLGAAVTGAIDDQSWRDRIRERLVEAHGAAAAAAERDWSTPCGTVDRSVLALVGRVRSRHPVALLTNATTRLEVDLAALGLTGAFDAVISSARIGVAKPAAAAFEHAARALGRTPDAALFVDDTEQNVVAAEALGFPVHLFRGADGLEDTLRACCLLA